MGFEKGHPKIGGKVKGTPNKLTKTVKETFLGVFLDLQQDPKHNLRKFAEKYPRDFYALSSKLIPTEVKGEVELTGVKQIIIEPASKNKG